MKSERRHELESNELANQLGKTIESSRGYLSWIVAAVGLVVLAVVGWGVFNARSVARTSQSWLSLYFAGQSDDELQELRESRPARQVEFWALQRLADNQLSNASSQLFFDRVTSLELLAEAEANYRQIADGATDRRLRARAQLGLAKALESQGKLNEAIESYRTAMSMDGINRPMQQAIQQRLDELQAPDAEGFYAWIATTKPASPLDSLNLPDDFGQIPDQPDLTFPDLTFPDLDQTPPADPLPEATLELPGDASPQSEDAPTSSEASKSAEDPPADGAIDPQP